MTPLDLFALVEAHNEAHGGDDLPPPTADEMDELERMFG